MSKSKVFPFHIKSGPWTGKVANIQELKGISGFIKKILPSLQLSSVEDEIPEFVYVPDKPLSETNLFTHLKQGGILSQI